MASEYLTKREREVLCHMDEGLSNPEIAARMEVALSTVKWYAQQIFNKLDVNSRQEAVVYARALGLLVDRPKNDSLVGNLPAQLSPFVGREHEIDTIRHLLMQGRLVTLSGAGGSGKTRLALKVAAMVAADYPDGITLVSLAATRDPSLVGNAIANALGVTEQPQQPLIQTLQRYLTRKRMLLILDNFEHLLVSAPLLCDLVGAAPYITVLVTSREPLNLSGEYEFLVPPLAVPQQAEGVQVSDLLGIESVNLFVQRARMASHSFELTENNATAVAAICMRLDGLPLAIELAAARTKHFSPQQVLTRLNDRLGFLVGGPRDLPQRQQTLRDTIDWSYDLLDSQEQVLFARLAVFNGGHTMEAVEAVCDLNGACQPVQGLESLLNKNLLYLADTVNGRDSAPRFYMLHTLQEYAHERLCARGEETAMRNRHLAYYLQLCEVMAPGYWGSEQMALFRDTEVEMDNIRTAFTWALESGQTELAARLITAVNYFLRYHTKSVTEGYRLVQRVLGSLDTISLPNQVPFLIGASELAFQNNDLAQYRSLAQQSLQLAYALGDEHLIACALVQGVDFTGDTECDQRAISHGHDALVRFRKLHDKPGTAYTLNRLGEVYRLIGKIDYAKGLYEEALAICNETGELLRVQMLQANLGLIAYEQGAYERALELHLSIVQLRDFLGSMVWTVMSLSQLAGPVAKLGEPEKAAKILAASTKMMAELGLDFHPYDQAAVAQYEADIRELLEDTTFDRAWAEGYLMSYEEAVLLALGDYL